MILIDGLFNSGIFKGGIFNGGIFSQSSVWSPLSLFSNGEQGALYDPSDFSTLYQDSAGTTPVTAVSQPVGKMLDISGNNNHAYRATASSRPVLRQNGSGYYYLEFDGVDDSLSTNTLDLTVTDSATLFVGIKNLQDTINQIVVDVGHSFSNTYSFGIAAPLSTLETVSFGSRGSTTIRQAVGTIAAAPVTGVFVGITSISSDICKLRYNGSEIASNTGDQGTGTYLSSVITIGSGPGYYRFKGNIYAIVVRGIISNDKEITDTETFINSKTGAY